MTLKPYHLAYTNNLQEIICVVLFEVVFYSLNHVIHHIANYMGKRGLEPTTPTLQAFKPYHLAYTCDVYKIYVL